MKFESAISDMCYLAKIGILLMCRYGIVEIFMMTLCIITFIDRLISILRNRIFVRRQVNMLWNIIQDDLHIQDRKVKQKEKHTIFLTV